MTSAAMASVAFIMAYQVASRATRDTLFLSHFHVHSVLLMISVAAIPAIVTSVFATRAIVKHGPARFVSAAFLVSAVLTLAEWRLALAQPGLGAIVVYLHVAAISPVLLSGFWSVVNEAVDSRTAKRSFGRIAAMGTLGGLVGFALGERLTAWAGAASTLPALALVQVLCAWSTRRLPVPGEPRTESAAVELLSLPEAGRRLLGKRYLRNVALLVVGSSVSATLLDYVFWAQTSDVSHQGLFLMRVFSAFNLAVAVGTFAVQALLSRAALERLGVAPTVGSLPAAMAVGGGLAALLPSPVSGALVRGLGTVLRGSLFRAGYDVLYTAVPAAERRATKTLVDVGCDRFGDILGCGGIALVLALAPGAPLAALFGSCAALAAATLLVVRQLRGGYVASLEQGLRDGMLDRGELDRGEITTQITLAHVLGGAAPTPVTPGGPDLAALAQDLASPDPARVRAALSASSPLDPAFVAQAIRLLAREDVARDAARALLPVATRHVGQLVDALLDPASELHVRYRVPRILASCPLPRAVDGLTSGLADTRFDVRYACGRALARLLEPPSRLVVDRDRILEVVLREARHERRVWDSQRALEQLPDAGEDAYVDAFLRDRAGRSLEHVFTLLSLVLPREPLRIAFRGLLAGDPILRGRALEYLENVLPPDVREELWPHLEPDWPRGRAPDRPASDREQVLDDLLRSNASIEISLEALRRKQGEGLPGADG